MLLLGGPYYCLLLATARHVVALVGSVFVLTSTEIEIVPLPAVKAPVKEIVAIPAVEHILALGSPQPLVVACAPVEHVVALVADQFVPARFAVENVLATVGVVLELQRNAPSTRLSE
jgi:hypothetical protein